MKTLNEMAVACERLQMLIDELDRLGMVVAAALASQAYDAAQVACNVRRLELSRRR